MEDGWEWERFASGNGNDSRLGCSGGNATGRCEDATMGNASLEYGYAKMLWDWGIDKDGRTW